MIINQNTNILIQGMTGKEGLKGFQYMKAANAKILAGVTPGKGGQEVEGVPIYDTVLQAIQAHPELNTSSCYVPPKFVLSAAIEALEAGIKLIHIFAENVPVLDTLKILKLAQAKNARILGPSGVGIIVPGVTKVGSIGATSNDQFLPVTNTPGVAVISKSGGMSNEVASLITSAGIPQSLVAGIGGDRFIGTTFADLLPELMADEKTGAIVIVGEIGGSYEENFAHKLIELKTKKPVVAFVSGLFAETLPQGVSFGHAGAIVSKSVGTRQGKIDALTTAGAKIAQSPEEIVELIQALPIFSKGNNG